MNIKMKNINEIKNYVGENTGRVAIILLILVLILGGILFLIEGAKAQTAPSVCCEKTLSGAYCQNSDPSECDPGFRSTPTSCEATSFCKTGCCYDSDEGICMENTPEEACKAVNGVWSDSPTCAPAETPQCSLGCCLLGEEAAFVPLVRCQKLSALYGLETNFRADVTDEVSCIDLATSQDVGACVYVTDFVTTTCKFTTRLECNGIEGKSTLENGSVRARFYNGKLCTAPELETNCQPTENTRCVDGKDEVYFVDSCGNTANIYDSRMIYDSNKGSGEVIEYWSTVKTREESCNPDSSNAGSRSCGNCEYIAGSICARADGVSKPVAGDFICEDINCYDTTDGKDHKNGESWCFYDDNRPETDSVGSRYFRHVCLLGEEIIEPCADYRQEICIENSIDSDSGEFSQSGCVVNRWQDCVLQNSSDDCLNTDRRDCEWISLDPEDISKGAAGLTGEIAKRSIDRVAWDGFKNLIGSGSSLRADKDDETGRCVPKFDPGLQFWNPTGNAGQQCSLGTQSCVVKYEKTLLGGKKCVENCHCLTEEAKFIANRICNALGDCGAGKNYLGRFVNKGYEIKVVDGKEEAQKADSGGADTSNGGSGGTQTPPSGEGQTFGGSQGQQNFGGSPDAQAAQAAQGTGSVIQGLIIKSYNAVAGSGGNQTAD